MNEGEVALKKRQETRSKYLKARMSEGSTWGDYFIRKIKRYRIKPKQLREQNKTREHKNKAEPNKTSG